MKADRTQSTEGLSSCLLVTYLDSARKLPVCSARHVLPPNDNNIDVGCKARLSEKALFMLNQREFHRSGHIIEVFLL